MSGSGSGSEEAIEYDVAIVGGGPAGLATAIRLKQKAATLGTDISVCVLEKAAEFGAHTLSGAVIDTRALDELLPDWNDAPCAGVPVREDEFYVLRSPTRATHLPRSLVPRSLHNDGCRIVSLGEVCRWLAERAAALDVDLFPGFAAAEALIASNGAVAGVRTGDLGRDRFGTAKATFEPGIEINAKYTVFAEGARGHIGTRLIERFGLATSTDPQHFGIGIKELWETSPDAHREGLALHGFGWPLGRHAGGGFFAYHAAGNLVSVGIVVDLNYANPWLDPFGELQRLKEHPLLAETLRSGQRIGYGARAIAKGGFNALPRMSMPGALLIGCDAGTLDVARIKGTHTAMKSGIVAADVIGEALARGIAGTHLDQFERDFAASWAGRDLKRTRNFAPALHRFGSFAGGAYNWIEQSILRGRSLATIRDRAPDHTQLRPASNFPREVYPRPDGKLTFDRMSSVFLSGTRHEPDQPCHLRVEDPQVPLEINWRVFAGPEERYCPAGVYEYVEADGARHLQIHAENCLHCKVCDIKDPRQNIRWVPPESGGPSYGNM